MKYILVPVKLLGREGWRFEGMKRIVILIDLRGLVVVKWDLRVKIQSRQNSEAYEMSFESLFLLEILLILQDPYTNSENCGVDEVYL